MKRVLAAALFLLGKGGAQAEPRHYEIQPSDASRLELRVYKTGIYGGKSHLFVFPRYSGFVDYDAQRPDASRAELRLDANSIHLTDAWLSAKDLKSVQEYALKDMLDAGKYPQILFKSSHISNGERGLEALGVLTIRGIEKPAILHVSVENGGSPGELIFRGDARVKLTDYKLKPPNAALGLVGTKDEMDFNFTVSVRP